MTTPIESPDMPTPECWMSASGEITWDRAKAERWIANGGTAEPMYTAAQLRAYGDKRAAMAREKTARHIDAPLLREGKEFAAAIRAMKDAP